MTQTTAIPVTLLRGPLEQRPSLSPVHQQADHWVHLPTSSLPDVAFFQAVSRPLLHHPFVSILFPPWPTSSSGTGEAGPESQMLVLIGGPAAWAFCLEPEELQLPGTWSPVVFTFL